MLISAAGSLPPIIQGGMGVGVSNWRLAQAVSLKGMLGVISGTVIDAVMVRRLQLGDPGGHMRRALAAFPCASTAQKMLDDFFVEGGIPAGKPFHSLSMPSLKMNLDRMRTMVVAAFAETWLAREGHTGPVGINLLEKVQLPNLPTLYGAMLAGAHAVLMGAGVPLAIPGALDGLAAGQEVRLRLDVREAAEGQTTEFVFDPAALGIETGGTLRRPDFLAIISSHVIGRVMVRKASGRVDGFVVENHTAGGHNAPPRQNGARPGEEPAYTERDIPDLERIAELGLPFWVAGSCASPEKLAEARAAGAAGIQIGSAFAFCRESGITPELKRRALAESRAGRLTVLTDFRASPTGYPFKLIPLEGTLLADDGVARRKRVCDLGFLRSSYIKEDGELGYRCPAEPETHFERKGGGLDETEGRLCLCNGLLATIGLGQRRADGEEQPIMTAGDAAAEAASFLLPGQDEYTAAQVIDRVLGLEGATGSATVTGSADLSFDLAADPS